MWGQPMERIAIATLTLLSLSLPVMGQTLQHFSVPPQYKNQKVLLHLEALENQMKALRKAELKVNFYGWPNPDLGAAAEKGTKKTFDLMAKNISDMEDIRANGSYSIRSLFTVYTTASLIASTSVSLADQVFQAKHDGELSAEILGKNDDVSFSLMDVEDDIRFALDFEGDMLLTLEAQPACK
jgi:hypothetical protein